MEKKQHPSSLQSKGCPQSPLPHPSAKKSPCPSRAPCLWVRLPVQNSVGTKPGGSSPPSPAGTPARRDGHFPGRRRTGARTKAHPGRDTPMGPAATPAPAQKSTRCQCNPPRLLLKRKDFSYKEKLKQGSPLQPPLGESLRSPGQEFAVACHCGGFARQYRPLTRQHYPPRRPPHHQCTLTSSTEACPVRLVGTAGRRRARCVLVAVPLVLGVQLFPSGETSPLTSPPVPACRGGQGHAPTLAAMSDLNPSGLGAHGAGGTPMPLAEGLCPLPGCGEGGQSVEKPHRCTQGLRASSGDACNARR